MKVLLIQPPDEMEAMLGVGKAFVQKYEPLGLLYIAAGVRNAGHRVAVIDAYAESLSVGEVRSRVLAEAPDVVGISVLTCGGAIAHDLGLWLRKEFPETTVVFGNVHASEFAAPYLEAGCCDFVVHGDGETPFLKILESREGKIGPERIPAVSFKSAAGVVVRTGPAAWLEEDLGALARPARDLLNPACYPFDPIGNGLYVPGPGERTMSMSTSRGCWYKCTFCVVNNKPRFNEPVRVVDEMERIEKETGARYIMIVDPLCMYDRERMLRICELIVSRGLSVKWGCDARVSCMTPELVRAMEAANCFDLSFGIESGVQRLLNAVKKGTTIAQIERAVWMVKENSDIGVAGLFILGLPTETPEESLETIAFAKGLPLDMAQFSICTPYPGSGLFHELRASGELDTGIRPGGELDASVWKRYSAYASFTDADPIWVTPTQTPEGLKALQRRAQREFYLRPSMMIKHARRVRPGSIMRTLRIFQKAFA